MKKIFIIMSIIGSVFLSGCDKSTPVQTPEPMTWQQYRDKYHVTPEQVSHTTAPKSEVQQFVEDQGYTFIKIVSEGEFFCDGAKYGFADEYKVLVSHGSGGYQEELNICCGGLSSCDYR